MSLSWSVDWLAVWGFVTHLRDGSGAIRRGLARCESACCLEQADDGDMYALNLGRETHRRFGQLLVELINEVHFPIQALDLPCSEAESEDGLFRAGRGSEKSWRSHTGTREGGRDACMSADAPELSAMHNVRLAMSARTRVVGVTSYLCAADVDVDGDVLLLEEA